MKTLVLIHEYPPVGTGGGMVAEAIASELSSLGVELYVLPPNLINNILPEIEIRGGVNIIRVPTNRKELHRATILDMLSYIYKGYFATKKLLKNWKPDIIHVHFAVPAGVLAWIISKLYKIPYVITIHLGDVPGGAPNKTKKWFRWVYPFTHVIWRSAAKIVAVSEFTRNIALESYKSPIEVIPNGIKMNHGLSKNIVVNKIPKIVFAGRIVEQKNTIQLVRILSELRDLPWECVMLGDGPLYETTKTEIEILNLQNRISMPGWVLQDRVNEELNNGDILFMPSLTEGMPIIGIQALVAGLAIVASNSFSDLIEQGVNGYFYSFNDNAGMQAGLRSLLNNKEKLLGARKESLKISKQFDINLIANKYLDLFENVKNH